MLGSREKLTAELNKKKEEFLATGKSIKIIPLGLSGADPDNNPSSQQKLLRVQRAKLAPELRTHADAGESLQSAARAMKIKYDRARTIARENNIIFKPDL